MRAAPEGPHFVDRLQEDLETADGPVSPDEYADLARAYLRLDARFAKVLAISDKYYAEIRDLERRVPVARGDGKASCVDEDRSHFRRTSDPLINRLRTRLAAEEVKGDTLASDAARLLRRYERANARMEKILTISDGYQAQLKDLLAQVGKMAHTDVLTGLPNRRAMIDRLEIELARAERYDGVFSVAIFDVDDFKRVNDTYGHEAGDIVLSTVAKTLRGALRRSDACARWGGEEFLVLFPETDLLEAMVGGVKVINAVAAIQIPRCEGKQITVTVSGGVATYRRGLELDGILKDADAALYRAKAAGKNQVLS